MTHEQHGLELAARRSFTVRRMWRIGLCAIFAAALCELAPASKAGAQNGGTVACGLAGDGFACPSEAMRPFILWFGGPFPTYVRGDNVIKLGQSNGVLVACVDDVPYAQLDSVAAQWVPGTLDKDRHFCAGPGNDTVRVITTTETCGNGVLEPLAYNGKRLVLYGQDGNDKLAGGVGVDELCGGEGDDTMRGGDGADRLLGGRGRDRMAGGPGLDTLLGGPDNDCLYGGAQGALDGVFDQMDAEGNGPPGGAGANECVEEDSPRNMVSPSATCGEGFGENSGNRTFPVPGCGGNSGDTCDLFCGFGAFSF